MKVMEIESTHITDSKNCFFKMDKGFSKNLHYVDNVNEFFINNLNYPVIKIKKLSFTKYESKEIPNDFDPMEYKSLHNDLQKMSYKQLIHHFATAGILEGRNYKKNQKTTLPKFIQEKIKGILDI